MQLSEHFTQEQLEHSDKAIEYGIENIMPDSILSNYKFLCEQILEPLIANYGNVQINSGWRSLELNSHSDIKGKPNSQHMGGLGTSTKGSAAVDIWVKGTDNADTFDWIVENINVWDQMLWEKGGAWIHISIVYNGRQNRKVIGEA